MGRRGLVQGARRTSGPGPLPALGFASCPLALWGGLSKSLPSPELCSSYKGLLCSSGALPALVSSGPPSLACSALQPHGASYWVIFFGYLVCCAIPSPENTLSGLSKEDTEDGPGQVERAPSPFHFHSPDCHPRLTPGLVLLGRQRWMEMWEPK